MKHECHKEEIISAMDKALNGNGQPGLRDVVAKLSVHVEGLNHRLDRMNKRSQFNLTTIIAIIAIAVSIFALYLKI